jgi:hypothetical protein
MPREPVHEVRNEGKDVRLQRREHRLAAVLGHHLVETGEPLVGHAAALSEALDDVVLHGAQEGDVLGEHRHVIGSGRPGQEGGMLRRQREMGSARIDFHHTCGDHRAEPLADVTLV